MLKRILATILLLCLLPAFALAQEGSAVVDLISHPDADWAFEEGADILEVYFPPVRGADACIIRLGDRVMMIDAGTIGQHARVAAALSYLNIDHVGFGFNTHPHDDHVGGFEVLHQAASMDHLYIAFPQDENNNMKNAMKAMAEQGVPVTRLGDGDLLPFEGVQLQIIQRDNPRFTINNRSAMVRLDYGERSMLLAADVELDAQNDLLDTAPEMLAVDILKYPHHGVARAGWNFLKHTGAELTVITNNRSKVKEARKDAEWREMTPVYTGYGMVRMRTDGRIWVVDQIVLDVE